jgi:hypothetical protein
VLQLAALKTMKTSLAAWFIQSASGMETPAAAEDGGRRKPLCVGCVRKRRMLCKRTFPS